MHSTKALNIGSKSQQEEVYIICLYKILKNIDDLKTLTNVKLKDLHDIIQNKDKTLALWYREKHLNYSNNWDDIDNILLKSLVICNIKCINQVFAKINKAANFLSNNLNAPSYYIRESVWAKIVDILEAKCRWKIQRDFTLKNLRVYERPLKKTGIKAVKRHLEKYKSEKTLTKNDDETFAESWDFPSLNTIVLNPELNEEHNISNDQINNEPQNNILSKKIKLESFLKEEPEEENYNNIDIKVECILKEEPYDLILNEEVKIKSELQSNKSCDNLEEEVPEECEEFISTKDEENTWKREDVGNENLPQFEILDSDEKQIEGPSKHSFPHTDDSSMEPGIVYEIDDSNDEIGDINLNAIKRSQHKVFEENYLKTKTEPIVIDGESDNEDLEDEDETIIELEIVSDEVEDLDKNEADINANILKELEIIIEQSKKQNEFNKNEASKLEFMSKEIKSSTKPLDSNGKLNKRRRMNDNKSSSTCLLNKNTIYL